MVKLIFKAYEKSCENIFLKEKHSKKARERYQNLPEKTKCANIFVSDIEIFLKKKNQKRCQYGREQLKKFFKDEKQRFQFLFSASGYSKKIFFRILIFTD